MRFTLVLTLFTLIGYAADANEDLLGAVRKGDLAAVKTLLDSGANVNAKSPYGATPLFFAADRGNIRVSDRFDPLSAPVLRALKDIVDKGRKHGKPVALCGELASQPIGALALAILGFRSLSLSPSAVGPIKAMLLDLDCKKGAAAIMPFLQQPVGSVSIRHKLEGFAAAEGLQL